MLRKNQTEKTLSGENSEGMYTLSEVSVSALFRVKVSRSRVAADYMGSSSLDEQTHLSLL